MPDNKVTRRHRRNRRRSNPFAQQPRSPYPYAAAYPYAGLPQRAPRSAWFWPLIILGSILLLALLFWALVYSAMHAEEGSKFGADRIGVIELKGVIVDAEKFDTQLRKFGDDDSIKAIILHIDSPGGGAAASQEIYHEVLRIRSEKHKKIVASVESVGASGAYYIASACDQVYANEASVVGSIGVIMEWTNYGDLMRWAKLKPVVIHAGELKDAGDPTHDMTPQEAAYFQSLVDNMYAQFIHDVATGRHTTSEKISPTGHRSGLDRPAIPAARPDRQDRRLPRRAHRYRARQRNQERAGNRPPFSQKGPRGPAQRRCRRSSAQSNPAAGPFSRIFFPLEVNSSATLPFNGLRETMQVDATSQKSTDTDKEPARDESRSRR